MYKTDTYKGPTVKPLNSFLVVQEKGGEGGIGTSEKLILEGKPEEIDRGRRGIERNWS